ncbi:hypothetical protein [Paenibacillus sambharensis]|nr:hypothetical protein [Paenibacillus sambharensis]
MLDAHAETIEVMHVLKPFGVCMAGVDEFDPRWYVDGNKLVEVASELMEYYQG